MGGVPLWFWAAVAFIVGICIGSFLNVVVIYRLPIATKGPQSQQSQNGRSVRTASGG